MTEEDSQDIKSKKLSSFITQLLENKQLNELFVIKENESEENNERRVRELLCGSDFSFFDFLNIHRHVQFINLLSDNNAHHELLDILECIINYGMGRDGVNNDINKWIEAGKYIRKLKHFQSKSLFDININSIIHSIKKLREYRYEINIVNGKPTISDKDKKRFINAIDYRFKKVGCLGIEFILQDLHKIPKSISQKQIFNNSLNRYLFRFEPRVCDKTPLAFSWGYLYNVALSYISVKPLSHNSDIYKTYKDIRDLSQLFFSVFELQPLSKTKEIYSDINNTLDELKRNILYDQLYSIDQYDLNEIIQILQVLVPENSVHPEYKILINIAKWLNQSSLPDKIIAFTQDQICSELSKEYSNDEVRRFLDDLSIDSKDINPNSSDYENIENRNSQFKPFIKIQEKYIFVSRYFSSIGFLNYLIEKLEYERKTQKSKIEPGKLLEAFISKKLTEKGVIHTTSKEYYISEDIKNDLEVNSENRECDIIIECKNTIYFLEVKKNQLSPKARSGNLAAILNNIAYSLLFSLNQSGFHEYCLQKNNYIEFKDGTKLELNQRKIQRISVSLFDFYSLRDEFFLRKCLAFFLKSNLNLLQFKHDNIKSFEKQHKIWQTLYNTPLFKKLYEENGQVILKSLFNCMAYSIFQFLVILKDVTDNESFEKYINMTSRISIGDKDWYQDFNFIRSLQQYKK